MADGLSGSIKSINDIENYCTKEYKSSSINSETMLSCSKVKIGTKEGIVRDDTICSTGPSGAGSCNYIRIFIANAENKEYPCVIVSKFFINDEERYKKCKDEYDINCLVKNFGVLRNTHRKEIEKFNKFIRSIQFGE